MARMFCEVRMSLHCWTDGTFSGIERIGKWNLCIRFTFGGYWKQRTRTPIYISTIKQSSTQRRNRTYSLIDFQVLNPYLDGGKPMDHQQYRHIDAYWGQPGTIQLTQAWETAQKRHFSATSHQKNLRGIRPPEPPGKGGRHPLPPAPPRPRVRACFRDTLTNYIDIYLLGGGSEKWGLIFFPTFFFIYFDTHGKLLKSKAIVSLWNRCLHKDKHDHEDDEKNQENQKDEKNEKNHTLHHHAS